MDPEYSLAQRAAGIAGLIFAGVLLVVSLDVALGGRLTRRGRNAYAWGQATEPEGGDSP